MKRITWICASLLFTTALLAQQKPQQWNLKSCIDYALTNNIQVKQSLITYKSGIEDTKQAKAQFTPSLSASSSQSFSRRAAAKNSLSTGIASSSGSYTGNYSLGANWTIFAGGERYYNLKQSKLTNSIQELAIEEAKNNIELQITQVYLQLLYAHETVKINENTVTVSKVQLDRSKALLAAGSIAKTDVAQLEAQYSTDKYQLVEAQTTLEESKLQLKQLLELDINEEMNLSFPELSDEEVMQVLPAKTEIYQIALQSLPEIKSMDLSIQSAKIGVNKAKAGYLPTISLNASLGTGTASANRNSFSSQLNGNFNQNMGLSLNIPILNQRSTTTAVKKAKLQIEQSELEMQSAQKELLKSIETVYQAAISYQNRYTSALENVKYVESSNELVQEQFNLGIKNTLELLTEKSNLVNAQQEMVQAKYMTIMNLQLLNFYQKKPIQINE